MEKAEKAPTPCLRPLMGPCWCAWRTSENGEQMHFLVFLQTKRAWVQQKPPMTGSLGFLLLNKWFLLPLQSPSLLKYQCWPWVVSGHLPLEPRVSSPEARVPTIWPEVHLLPPPPMLLAARASGHLRGLRSGYEQEGGLGTRGPLKQKRSTNRILTLGKVFFPPSNIGRGFVNTNLTWALVCRKKAWINPLSEWKIPLSYQLFFFFLSIVFLE